MKKLFLAMAIAIVTATAVSAQKKENMMVVSSVQADKNNGYTGNSAIHCGIRFNIKLSGVTKIELESVDGNPLAGKAHIPRECNSGSDRGRKLHYHIRGFRQIRLHAREGLLYLDLALRPLRRIQTFFLQRWPCG